jgi:hypothetical protein
MILSDCSCSDGDEFDAVYLGSGLKSYSGVYATIVM